MRTWMRLIPAVLMVLPYAGSALAVDAETNDEKIKKLQEDIAQIRKDLDNLKDEVRKSSARGARIAEDLKEIKDMLREQEARTRQSLYLPSQTPGAAPASPPTSGTIMLENVYSAPATVHINGQSYFVEPNRTRIVPNFPLGPFQYSVDVEGFGTVRPLSTATLRPAGYRIRIFPSMPF